MREEENKASLLVGFNWERKWYQRVFNFIGTQHYFESKFKDLVSNKSIFLSGIFIQGSSRACFLRLTPRCWSHFAISFTQGKRWSAHLLYFQVLLHTEVRMNSRFKLNFSSFCSSLVICACANQPTGCQRAWSNISSLRGSGAQSSRTHPGWAQNL